MGWRKQPHPNTSSHPICRCRRKHPRDADAPGATPVRLARSEAPAREAGGIEFQLPPPRLALGARDAVKIGLPRLRRLARQRRDANGGDAVALPTQHVEAEAVEGEALP